MNEDWKSKRYRYQITLQSGQTLTSDYFDTYQDLENFIRTGAAGFYTPHGYVDTPIAQIKAVQPIEEGQASGAQPMESQQPTQPPQSQQQPDQPVQPSQPPMSDIPMPPQAGSVVGPTQEQKPEQPTEGELPL